MKHPTLSSFLALLEKKSEQVNRAVWLLETTGSQDALSLKADLDTELKCLLSDRSLYSQIIAWEIEAKDLVVKRELNVLKRLFKPNQIDAKKLEAIAQKEASLSQLYTSFRAEIEGKTVSENEIREMLRKEADPEKRKKIWAASKVVGEVLAPPILELVEMRNQGAKELGYSNFFTMQLDLQEVDSNWLDRTFEDLSERSQVAYNKVVSEIEEDQKKRFSVSSQELGPWSFEDPFAQEDPLAMPDLDSLVARVDIVNAVTLFYDRMGFDVREILKRSDMEERPSKTQHAFCIHIDRKGDVRTVNNVKPTLRWLEVVLHELGHAVYEEGFDPQLPWLLKEPPHMITTEAIALLMGRQAYKADSLSLLVKSSQRKLLRQAEVSLRRRQLIFSRWVLVMTAFEKELYRNPAQNLNRLWWELVEKYQRIRPPKGREGKADWAAKYHIGLAPVYYFSYLLGEMFASSIQKEISLLGIASVQTGKFLKTKIFWPGNRFDWKQLVYNVTGDDLKADAWLSEYVELL